MFAVGGSQILQNYSSQARSGEILTSNRGLPTNQPRLTGTDNVDISGRSKAIAVAKAFTARLNLATQAAEPTVSKAIGLNQPISTQIQETINLRKRAREEGRSVDLPKEASLGFSSLSKKSVEIATQEINKLQEPPPPAPDKYKTRIQINDFSMKFIRALNPIAV